MKRGKRKLFRYWIMVSTIFMSPLGMIKPVEAATKYDCEAGIHRYTVTIEKPAELEEPGIRSYTCELCEHSYEEEIPGLGHAYGEWVVEIEADCIQEGLRYRVCEEPIHERSLPAEGMLSLHHDEKTDNSIREEEIIPAGEHNYVADSGRSVPPTCEEDGTFISVCTGCGMEQTKVAAAVGHAFGDWVVKKDATVFRDGLKIRVCSNDPDHIEEEIIAKGIGNMTMMDTALATANTVNILVFSLLLRHDYIVIIWNRRKVQMLIKNGVTGL